jgi:hypothetical protein
MPNNLYKYFVFCLPWVLFGCGKNEAKVPVKTNQAYKVLILGNSITHSPPNQSINWNGNWGMAASVADSDYVHLLTAQFKALNSSSTVASKNIAAFENNFDTYDFSQLQSLRDAKPDIIILRIGENVTRVADSVLFEKRYVDLLSYLKVNNANAKLLAAGSVWSQRDMANRIMSKHSIYISLNALESVPGNLAFGLYSDPGVQLHPSNKGMKAISATIWAEVKKLLQIT